MVEIFGKLVELEILGDAIHGPGFCVWLERAQQDFARVFLVIGAFIGDAQYRHLAERVDALGHDVEVFAGMKRHIHTRHPANLVPPHARAVHHHIGLNVALCGAVIADPVDAGDATA